MNQKLFKTFFRSEVLTSSSSYKPGLSSLDPSGRQTTSAKRQTPSLSRLRASFAGCRQMIDGRETDIYLVNHILGAFFVSSCPRQKYQGHLFRPKRARGDQGRAQGAAG